jgi:hypothetical protein
LKGAKGAAGSANRYDFRVCAGIIVRSDAICAFGDDLAFLYNHRAERAAAQVHIVHRESDGTPHETRAKGSIIRWHSSVPASSHVTSQVS